ncbi:MAG TPA: aldo/keto reductase [Tepidisphaeraceae bacterium]|nr:aldo/keto reductase [Tepidisphaeraceae bacterium]
MHGKLNWGIIGTGAIAKTFARALAGSKKGNLLAVASRSHTTAEAFASEFKVDHAYDNYESILSDQSVDAVYISTPHPFHAEWTIRACRAKKHVLVEKPMAINHADAMAMIEAAIENDVFLMEAFMYRCHPQTMHLMKLLGEGAIGKVQMIQATFGFEAGFDPEKRLFKNALAGGGILDVGCYPASMARLIAGTEPIEVKGVGQLGKTGVDEAAAAVLKFPNDIVAQLSTSIRVRQDNIVRIFGSEGQILLPNPWVANRTAPDQGKIMLHRWEEHIPREIVIEATETAFTYEADIVGHSILAGLKQAPVPAMTWTDSLGNIATLDAWRDSIGLVYDSEKPENYRTTTVAGTRLRHRDDAPMKYGKIEGIDKPVSCLIMGCDNQKTLPHSAVMYDDFFERGGNTFDTAWIYGGGLQEKLLGQWIKNRNVHDQVVLIAKGAHTPLCTPRDLSRQLVESLERLDTDHADIYMLHRDNPDVPVGEFVDVLNLHRLAGRIKIFGGSNWSIDRIRQANEYAMKNKLIPFSVVSNQFSLARMIEPIWKGCFSASDDESRSWLEQAQMPLLAWSSQSRGFFVQADPNINPTAAAELVRCWYSPENSERLHRVNILALKKKVLPINIALAYVLNQPFPTFALIGPRKIEETRISLKALNVELTTEEMTWLDLRD